MIFVRDKGRMCNNILQYGHVYAWAREHGRRTVSMRFCYKYKYFAISHTRGHNLLTYLLAKYAAKIGLLPIAAFHNPEGNPEAMALLESGKNVVVEGWYARFYDLFIKYIGEIRQLFAFDKVVLDAAQANMEASDRSALIDSIQTKKEAADARTIKLGLHIRRGDYRTWHNGKYFFGDDVYAAYVNRFASLHPGMRITVYVCGNDPALNKAYYTEHLPGIDVRFPQGNPGEDLCLLSQCDWLIGPPSTFTLVAAMYRDIPLCWMETANAAELTFKHFNELFRNIK